MLGNAKGNFMGDKPESVNNNPEGAIGRLT